MKFYTFGAETKPVILLPEKVKKTTLNEVIQ